MKVKRMRNILMLAAGLCCATALGVAVGTTATAAVASDVTMIDGASVRVNSLENSGIRFIAKVANYDKNASTKYGMLIVPYNMVKNYAEGADYIAELEKAYPTAADKLAWEYCTPYQAGKDIQWLNDTDGYYIVASIVKLLDTNYDTEFVGLAFSETDGVKSFVALEEENKRDIATVASRAYKDVVAEGEYVDEIDEIIDKSLVAYGVTETQGFVPEFETTEYALLSSDVASIAETNGLPVVYTTDNAEVASVANGKIEIAGEGECEITASFGKYTQTISVAVSDAKTLAVDTASATLLTAATVDGTQNAEKTTANVTATYTYEIKGGEGEAATDLEWTSADQSVVTVENGVITAVGSGSTKVTVSGEGYNNSIEIPVTVYVPIKTANDMDALSLITYNYDKDTATKMMGYNYLLMNDIDYSTHVRNFVLPIASPAGATTVTDASTTSVIDLHTIAYLVGHNVQLGSSSAWRTMGIYSHFSETWSKLLGLTMVADATNGSYMTKADGSKFTGINPNLIPFTGVLNGNGYAIKNAWAMGDNYLCTFSWGAGATVASGSCFIGLNNGTVCNLVLDNFTMPNSNTQLIWTGNANGLNTVGTYKHSVSTKTGTTLQAKYTAQWNSYRATYSMTLAADGKAYYMGATTNTYINYGQYSDYSGVILANSGTIENVKLVYTTTAAACNGGAQSATDSNANSPRTLADGLVVYNAYTGTIKNVIVQRTDPDKDVTGVDYSANSEVTDAGAALPRAYYLTAMLNFGVIEDVAVSNQMAYTGLKDASGNSVVYRQPMDVLGTAKNVHEVTVYTDTAMTESDYVTLTKVI